METRFSRLAITSFAIGLLSVIVLPPLLALAALILGIVALNKIKHACGALKGKGMAVTGVVLGGFVWLLIIAGLVLAICIRTHYQPFKIPTNSMAPAIKRGQRAIIDRKAYNTSAPLRGDIIVYFPGTVKKIYMKRVVGMPGESLEIKDGSIYINGKPMSIPGAAKTIMYLNGGDFGQQAHPVKIPVGAYFVLGDNPAQSRDSRYSGFVKKEAIWGKVIATYKGSREEVTMELLKLFFEGK